MKVYEAFCGIGGFSLGFQRAGFEIIGGCEVDPYARAVYKKNFGIDPDGDIKKITTIGGADVLCGGFPCQPFSLAGKRRGTADERHLWPEMLRLVASNKPRWVVGENVPGIGEYLDTVCADLEGEGYEVLPLIIPAAVFGAPHLRNRIWIIAHRNGPRRKSKQICKRNDSPEFGNDGEKKPLADANRPRFKSRGLSGRNEKKISEVDNNGGILRDSSSERLPNGANQTIWRSEEKQEFERSNWWTVEPDVGRVVNGVHSRVDRLKCLGNAIVPQIAQWIAQRIREIERN